MQRGTALGDLSAYETPRVSLWCAKDGADPQSRRDVYVGLVRRAAEAGISVPELLRAEAVRLATRLSVEAWLTRTRLRSSPLGRADVLAALDEHRGSWPDAGR